MDINEALKILELSPNVFDIPFASTYDLAVKKLNDFKNLINKQRKLLAKKYHPDITPESSEKMKLINNIVDQLMDLQVIKPQPRIRIFYQTIDSGVYDTTSTYSNVYYNSYYY